MPFAILLLLLVSPNAAVPPAFDELFRTGLIALQHGDLAGAESNLRAVRLSDLVERIA